MYKDAAALKLNFFTFTHVSVNFCVEPIYARSLTIKITKEERKPIGLNRLHFPSQRTKQPFYNRNMASYV